MTWFSGLNRFDFNIRPKEGEILAILWLVDEWLENEVVFPELPKPLKMEGERSSHTDEQHSEIVNQIKNSITAGELYQLNFGRTWEGPLGENPACVFHRLAVNNPAPFSGYIEAADLELHLPPHLQKFYLKQKKAL